MYSRTQRDNTTEMTPIRQEAHRRNLVSGSRTNPLPDHDVSVIVSILCSNCIAKQSPLMSFSMIAQI